MSRSKLPKMCVQLQAPGARKGWQVPSAAGAAACNREADAALQERDVRASCRYLTATDFSECHDRQATLKRIQLLEASVAASLGVNMVYSSPALRAKPEYYRYCTLLG